MATVVSKAVGCAGQGESLREASLEAQVSELRAQLEEKSAEVELLHEVTAGVAAARGPDEMLALICGVAVRVSGADSSSVYVFDETRCNLVLRAVHEAPRGLEGRLTLRIGEGITGWVARELLPVAIERHAYRDPRFKALPDLRDQRCESFLSVPMVAQNETLGVLNVKTREPHSYPARTVRLLQSVAAMAASAIQGMSLQESIQLTSTQLSAISEVSRTLTSNAYLEEILQLIVAMTAQTFNFKICTIMLVDEERQELVIKATQSKSAAYVTKPNLLLDRSVAGRAVQDGRVITVLDVRRAPEYRFPDIAQQEGLCSMACIPLRNRERIIGVLNCYTEQPRTFSPSELDSLQTMANQAAIAIASAKLMVRSAIIQEMHHRVKNSLQTVASLLRLQMHRAGEGTPEEMLRESIGRISSIAAVHDLLSREELDQVSLRDIAESILTHTGRGMLPAGRQVAMRVVGDDVTLPSSKATSVALVLNELVHNAVEHGLGEGCGTLLEVRLACRRPAPGSPAAVTVEVVNDGARIPPGFDPRSSDRLGLQIVARLAQNDLGGRFTLSSDTLTRATVTFQP
jgi:two-component sensor histidine kinase